VSCWDKECETLYRSFIRAPVGSSYYRVEQKKQERWEEAVNSIDFLHFNRKAWRTINKLTVLAGMEAPLACAPVSANTISSQLVKNGAHRTGGHKSTRFVNKQLSGL